MFIIPADNTHFLLSPDARVTPSSTDTHKTKPANTRSAPKVVVMSGRCRSRWPDISATLGPSLVFVSLKPKIQDRYSQSY